MLEILIRWFIKILSFFTGVDSASTEYENMARRMREALYFDFEIFLMGLVVVVLMGYLVLSVLDSKR